MSTVQGSASQKDHDAKSSKSEEAGSTAGVGTKPLSPPQVGDSSQPGETQKTPQNKQAGSPSSIASLGKSNDPTSQEEKEEGTRQVIAVSASKGPAAFFNLARKFLATDEMCDLSALEGAIVSAVDAAHLLERSQLATIVRVSTSYVTVEPKRRRQASATTDQEEEPDQSSQTATSGTSPSASPAPTTTSTPPTNKQSPPSSGSSLPSPPSTNPSRQGSGRSSGRELRRARIVITVQRTESYKKWLEENPLQAIISDVPETGLDQGTTPALKEER